MRPRILILFAVCALAAVGVYLLRSRSPHLAQPAPPTVAPSVAGGKANSAVTGEAARQPRPQETPVVIAPGALPPAPVARTATPQGIAPFPSSATPRPPSSELIPPPASVAAPVVGQVPPAREGAPQMSSDEVALDVEKIRLSLRDYRTVMKENPV